MANPSSCKVVLSKNIANGLLAEVQQGVQTLERPPHLMGFLANDDPAALMYAQWTEKTCEEKCVPCSCLPPPPVQLAKANLTVASNIHSAR